MAMDEKKPRRIILRGSYFKEHKNHIRRETVKTPYQSLVGFFVGSVLT